MYFIYDLAVQLTAILLHLPALFQPKLQKFLRGRKDIWSDLQAFRKPDQPLIWMHAASLGEFEQGLPVLESLQNQYPTHQFLVTFFSPSGYEIKKEALPGVGVTYLPFDTRKAARKFMSIARPSLALFIKYEVWPNLYREIAARGIPNLMISAIFRPEQAYFQWYGGFMRQALKQVRHFYLQDEASAKLLGTLHLDNHTVCGDTRFDRVLEILEGDNHLDFLERFKGSRTCMVAGSTWPEDQKVLDPFINALDFTSYCVVVAPHKVDSSTIQQLRASYRTHAVCYSDGIENIGPEAGILILDTIGLLTKVYSYADLAYVGGGFATGLHNTLEPAVFGIPVLIGPKYKGFREAEDMVRIGGISPVDSAKLFATQASTFFNDPLLRSEKGRLNRGYIEESRGASERILEGIRPLLLP